MAKKQKNSKDGGRLKAKIELREMTSEDQRPELAVYALDRSGKSLEMSTVDEEGQFQFSEKALKAAHRIYIGPKVEDMSEVDRKQLTVFRPQQFREKLERSGVFEIPRKEWLGWIFIKSCVSGSVRHCFPFPWYIDQLVLDASTFSSVDRPSAGIRDLAPANPLSRDAVIARPFDRIISPLWCRTVCDGLVEVYQRSCCCWPWIVYDPRLPDLIRELEDLLPDPPVIKWPPRPQPDPPPIRELAFFKDGALDRKVLNARKDLQAIRSLPQTELVEYINARPYLFCSCSDPVKVAEGFIQPDGDFHICWWHWPTILPVNCHIEYAFKVKQSIDGSTVTIYDGVASNQWFDAGEDADLVSYHPQAVTCGEEEVPGEGAFVLLQDIGLANSWRLKTPDATGWDRVDTPLYNDGLADPVANPADAIGKYRNRNWGGTLNLRYHFSEEMKDLGAKYYRVSVVASDANGNPTGDRTYLSPNEWKYFEVIFPDIFVRKVSLGPESVGGQNHLYEIPYHADREWLSGQYHAILDTRDFANGRFLLTVEVFDEDGQLIRPTGTPDPGGSTEGPFTYRRWYQEVGPTAEVPYAALTHMLWWDNRKAEALIEDFRVNGVSNTEECQFLEDAGTANFSVGYRAYHPEPMFLLDHRMWWRRGLGGPTGILTSPHPNPNNVGVPPALPHQSGSNTFADMLGPHTKCTFTINLHTNVKTFNGFGTLNGLDDWDQASVALSIGS